MFSKIVVGFDGSDTGHDGLALSISLAKPFGSRVVLAYVYDEELSGSSSEAAGELTAHADSILTGARRLVGPVFDFEFRRLAAGSPSRGLHDLAVSEDADLIVLGSRRLGPRTTAALGGVSESVMRAAPCSVAVAPRGYRDGGGFVPQTIGVGWIPTDEGDHALEIGCRIALATGGSVELVTTASATRSVEELGDRARGAVRALASVLGGEAPVAVHARVAEPADELIARSRAMDLMVLGSRGYGSPRGWRSGACHRAW